MGGRHGEGIAPQTFTAKLRGSQLGRQSPERAVAGKGTVRTRDKTCQVLGAARSWSTRCKQTSALHELLRDAPRQARGLHSPLKGNMGISTEI